MNLYYLYFPFKHDLMNANDKKNLSKLLKYIEENIRSSDTTTAKYIDPFGNIDRLNSKQNQVIYGRRGSGKSLLIKALKENAINDALFTKVNVEDFKDISFPDSLLQALKSFLKQLKKHLNDSYSFYNLRSGVKARRVIKKINSFLDKIDKKAKEPDKYSHNITETEGAKQKSTLEAKRNGIKAATTSEESAEKTVVKVVNKDKLDSLKKEISEIKELLDEVTKYFNNKNIFLVLDDFYFIKKTDQPHFVDFFHRLSKDTRLFLKVATIKHRSSLYTTAETYIGMEMRQDAQPIELDHTLDKYEILEDFMWQILKQVNKDSGAGIGIDHLLSPNAFKYLCIASGGVVRDFLSLFIQIGEEIKKGAENITKPDVIDIAISNIQNKLEALKTDSPEEKEVLENYLNYIKSFLVNDVKTNVFLVGLSDIDGYPEINQAIKELVDARLIHQIEPNISAKHKDNQRYVAYMIDVGFFPGARARNFNVIEPGVLDKDGRNDLIRSAPKIDLELFEKHIEQLGFAKKLEVTNA